MKLVNSGGRCPPSGALSGVPGWHADHFFRFESIDLKLYLVYLILPLNLFLSGFR